MDYFKRKNEASPLRIYKPSGLIQFGLSIGITFFVIHFTVLMGIGLQIGWLTIIAIPFYTFILWMLIISSTQQHLAIYEHGLEYRIGGTRLFSRWEDIRSFEKRSAGRSRIIGIYTVNMDRQKSGNFLENVFPINHHNFIPLNTVHIPTRWDGCWSGSVVDTDKLAQTDFGHDLLHFAPQLFEYGNEKQKNG